MDEALMPGAERARVATEHLGRFLDTGGDLAGLSMPALKQYEQSLQREIGPEHPLEEKRRDYQYQVSETVTEKLRTAVEEKLEKIWSICYNEDVRKEEISGLYPRCRAEIQKAPPDVLKQTEAELDKFYLTPDPDGAAEEVPDAVRASNAIERARIALGVEEQNQGVRHWHYTRMGDRFWEIVSILAIAIGGGMFASALEKEKWFEAPLWSGLLLMVAGWPAFFVAARIRAYYEVARGLKERRLHGYLADYAAQVADLQARKPVQRRWNELSDRELIWLTLWCAIMGMGSLAAVDLVHLLLAGGHSP